MNTTIPVNGRILFNNTLDGPAISRHIFLLERFIGYVANIEAPQPNVMEHEFNASKSISIIDLNFFFFQLIFSNGSINIPMLYLHRYIRLTPLLALSLFVTMTILIRYNNGPFWYSFFNGAVHCSENWWAALLYIQNYYNPTSIVRYIKL